MLLLLESPLIVLMQKSQSQIQVPYTKARILNWNWSTSAGPITWTRLGSRFGKTDPKSNPKMICFHLNVSCRGIRESGQIVCFFYLRLDLLVAKISFCIWRTGIRSRMAFATRSLSMRRVSTFTCKCNVLSNLW